MSYFSNFFFELIFLKNALNFSNEEIMCFEKRLTEENVKSIYVVFETETNIKWI
jgi:hypothetical protein